MASIRALKAYVQLKKRQDRLEDELKAIKESLKAREDAVLRYFEDQGLDHIRIDGMTLFLRRQVWAARCDGVTPPEALNALEEAGLGGHVAVNASSLSAFFRTLRKHGDPVPSPLDGVFHLNETCSIATRRSTGGA